MCTNNERPDRKFDQFGWFEPVIHYMVGVVAGAACVITGHPLDTVKVRQQMESSESIYRCCASLLKNEGILGFYKGMSSPLVSWTALNAILFGVYGNTLKLFEDKTSLMASFIAGNVAGVAQCIVCVPSDLIKTKMQLQKDKKIALYTSSYDCAKKLIKTRGLSSVFKGTWMTVARDGPGYGAWFVTYEYCTQKLSKDGTAQSLNTWQLLFAGALAGVVSWVCNYPVDVIKTRFQADDNVHTYKQVCRDIMRTSGVNGFFAGISATVLRAIPADASIFFAAEWSYRVLHMIIEWRESRNKDNNENKQSKQISKN